MGKLIYRAKVRTEKELSRKEQDASAADIWVERNQSERRGKAEGRKEATQVQDVIGATGERNDSTRGRIVS